MQISTAEQIKDRWPGAEVIISAPFPEIDRKLYKDYTVIKSSRRNLLFSTLQVIRAKIYTSLKKLGVNLNFLVSNRELSHFQSADIIIDLSGDTLTEDYGPHVTYSHFLPIWLGLSFKKPVFICAQSIGPFKLTKGFSRRLLNKASCVTAREEITYEYLSGIGVNKNILRTTADMAFLLEPAPKDRVDKILKAERVKTAGKPLLGVTISNLVVKRFNAANPDKDFVPAIARVLDEFITEHDSAILLLGHVTGPSAEKDDRLVARRIRQEMEQAGSVSVVGGDYSPGELKGMIARCDVFMGSRMHSNIAALSSCVPTLAIGYSHKTEGIMSLFDMKGFVVDIDKVSPGELLKLLRRAMGNKESTSRKLSKHLQDVRARSTENVEIIDSIVKGAA